MLGQLIWWSSITLEMVLLVRGLQSRLVYRLPVFYGYIAFVLLQDIIRFIAFHWDFGLYKPIYWGTEFLGLAIGSLVVFEIYKVSLAAYPGAARMARNALALVFLIALAKGFLDISASGWQTAPAALEMERALRAVQAAAILALVALFLLYSIPFGRNLRGILLGYGLFVGERVICLAFVSQQTHDFWFYAYSSSYIGALSLWLAHLWSYQAGPQPKASADLEFEYQRIANVTQRRLQGIRGYLRRAVGMSEFWGLLFGVLLLLALLVLATKGWLASRQFHEPAIGSIEEGMAEPCPEEFVFKVFSRGDWEFVHGLKARRIEQLFARERKKAALIWVRQTSGMIGKAMRQHAAAARQSKNLELSNEISILAQFLVLIVACGILSMAIQTAGPIRLSGLAHLAQRLSLQVTKLQGSFQAGVLEKARGTGIA